MKGNQIMINSQILEHPDNPIKEERYDKQQLDVIYMITDELWKEWRRQMTTSHYPNIYMPGLGNFSMMHGKGKSYLRKLIKRLRFLKWKYEDSYQVEGTRAYGMYQNALKRLR